MYNASGKHKALPEQMWAQLPQPRTAKIKDCHRMQPSCGSCDRSKRHSAICRSPNFNLPVMAGSGSCRPGMLHEAPTAVQNYSYHIGALPNLACCGFLPQNICMTPRTHVKSLGQNSYPHSWSPATDNALTMPACSRTGIRQPVTEAWKTGRRITCCCRRKTMTRKDRLGLMVPNGPALVSKH